MDSQFIFPISIEKFAAYLDDNLQENEIWSKFKIYEQLVTIIKGIDPNFSKSLNLNVNTIRETVYGNKEIKEINQFISTLTILTY